VHFSVLGSLEVRADDGSCIEILRPRLRSLLVILLVNNNKLMSTDRIARLLWDQDAPPGSTHAIHSYISSLRKIVGGSSPLANARPGYRINVSSDELDIEEFRSQHAEGVREFQQGELGRANKALKRACDVWRDISLPDFPPTPSMIGIARQLTEELYSAQDLHIDALLALDRPAEAIPILTARTVEHPGHERAWCQLMLALCRSGRRAQALGTFTSARQTLIDELGIEPGPSMLRLHARILHGDPELILDSEVKVVQLG
jgi:DNA-binding SARP family transcriptional activator